MVFNKAEAEQLLVDCGRRCCLCGELHDLQLHHIIPGDDNIENAISLCSNCHNNVHAGCSPGRITRSYTPEELKLHRKRTIDPVAQGILRFDKNVNETSIALSRDRKIDILKKLLSELHNISEHKWPGYN